MPVPQGGGSALVVCSGGGIGDALLATPVMRALHSRYAEITALTASAHYDVIGAAAADAVWCDDMPFDLLVRRIHAAAFDAAVVTWATPRIALALFIAGVPIRVGQSRRLYSSLFTHRVDVRSERGDHATHWTQILLDYARALDCDGDGTPIAPFDADADAKVGSLLAYLGIAEQPLILLHPTRGIAAHRERWPASSLAAVGTALRERFGWTVLVSGSHADRAIAEGISARIGALCIAGMTTLPQLTALAKRSRLVVAMDSGPMHLAAAVGAPTVGIFAMRPDEPERWRPLGAATAIVGPEYPCPRSHTKENCPNFACVRALDPARVVAAAAGLLANEREES